MRSMNSSVDTINAAATAIVSAEARAQPTTVPKRRWGSCWSVYWCFGSHKNRKRIGHAVLVPEPVVSRTAISTTDIQTSSSASVLPFIAPPSSPASFLPSDPSSATQSPAGFLSLKSLANAYSPGGPASMFSIGPYAYETQLVSPPVFSTFNTEPSTAPFTPPPESVQLTTPSSPEVPFAQLLTSSLDRNRRNTSGSIQKFPLSQYEYQPYQQYPGSPGGHLISPGSALSNSGTSSPFPEKHPLLEFRMGEAPKLFGFENFTTRKWGSRLGSGSLTPDGVGLGSRLGSGSMTPDGNEIGSRPDSGCLTPNGVGAGSRLGSGCLTPDGTRPASRDSFLPVSQISEVASLANSDSGRHNDMTVFDHRVSFELNSEDVAYCLANKSVLRAASESSKDIADFPTQREATSKDSNYEFNAEERFSRIPESTSGEVEDQCYRKQRSITLGSTKDFNFDNTKAEVLDKPNISAEWWANKNVAVKESKPCNDWTFFPAIQSGVR